MICTRCSNYRQRIRRNGSWVVECRNLELGIVTEIPEAELIRCGCCRRFMEPGMAYSRVYDQGSGTMRDQIAREMRGRRKR